MIKNKGEISMLFVNKIKWDTDGETIDELPAAVIVHEEDLDVEDFTNEEEVADAISDFLSDVYGFCHFGFNIANEIKTQNDAGEPYVDGPGIHRVWLNATTEDALKILKTVWPTIPWGKKDIGEWIGINLDIDDNITDWMYFKDYTEHTAALMKQLDKSSTIDGKIVMESGKIYAVPLNNGYLDVMVSFDSDYPGLDIEYIADSEAESDESSTRPRVLVEQPEGEELRVLVWADRHMEDYSDEIEFIGTKEE